MKNLVFCSIYNVSILFLIYKWYLSTCREHGHLQTCYPLWSRVSAL